MIKITNFYQIVKSICEISEQYGITFGGYQNVDFEFELEPSSTPKRTHQEDALDKSKLDGIDRPRGKLSNEAKEIFHSENLTLDSGSNCVVM